MQGASSTLIYLGGLADGLASSIPTVDCHDPPPYYVVQYIEIYGARLDSFRFATIPLLLLASHLIMSIALNVSGLEVYRLYGHMSNFRLWKQRLGGGKTYFLVPAIITDSELFCRLVSDRFILQRGLNDICQLVLSISTSLLLREMLSIGPISKWLGLIFSTSSRDISIIRMCGNPFYHWNLQVAQKL